jgi:hypothetical protein
MKNIFSILILSICSHCISQTPVVDLYNNGKTYGEIAGAYYKDTANFQDQYIGTWILNTGGITFKIIFRKKELHHVTNDIVNYYEDLLVGEYQLIINGVEKVNTLNNLNLNYSDKNDYNLFSVYRTNRNANAKCEECAIDEKRLVLYLNEPSRRQYDGLANQFILRKFTENGVDKLKVFFVRTDRNVIFDSEGKLSNVQGFSLPYGNYVLTKQ